jgi:hypothetical protein
VRLYTGPKGVRFGPIFEKSGDFFEKFFAWGGRWNRLGVAEPRIDGSLRQIAIFRMWVDGTLSRSHF